MKLKYLLLSLLMFIFVKNISAKCCHFSCDGSINSSFNYVDNNVKTAFEQIKSNLQKYRDKTNENNQISDKEIAILKAYLEREKISFLKEKKMLSLIDNNKKILKKEIDLEMK